MMCLSSNASIGSGSISTNLIILIVVGVIILIAAVVAIVMCCRRGGSSKDGQQGSQTGAESFQVEAS